jgi:glycosyltransferase involved in cell wall biosynthesis
MKVVNVHPGILPIPPQNWGAVEKIIWNYTQELYKLGIDASFKYLDDINPIEYDVIHCHVTNLANMAYERGMEYFFSLHDHHVLFEHPDYAYVEQTRRAIKNSIKTFVHTEEFFTHKNFNDLKDKFIYIPHGVDRRIYVNKNQPRSGALLCVASNGFIGFQTFDRKGFLLASQIAEHLKMDLTICCPSNTKAFIDRYNLAEHPNVKVLYDLSEEQLIGEYNKHSIFLHPSLLEAGHPNLTLVEALACGIPVVGSYKGTLELPGMCVVNDHNPVSYKNAILEVMIDYKNYATQTNNIGMFEWENVSKTLLGYYKKYGYTLEKFRQVLLTSYSSNENGTGRKILPLNKIHVNINESGDILLEINGPERTEYAIKFIGVTHNGTEVNRYETSLTNNMWCSSANSNFIQWNVYINNELYNIYPVERS